MSKAFGEQVEHQLGTPSLTAEELQALQMKGGCFILLDGRTPAEFHKMNIPGAHRLCRLSNRAG
jgi:rhodanese-related sulfurtransferase